MSKNLCVLIIFNTSIVEVYHIIFHAKFQNYRSFSLVGLPYTYIPAGDHHVHYFEGFTCNLDLIVQAVSEIFWWWQ